jgi:hypothetical protein
VIYQGVCLFSSHSFNLQPPLLSLSVCCVPTAVSFAPCHTCCSPSYPCFYTMGKTPASSRAGRKSRSKHPERKWCTCKERCNGGKEVAASTYRSHNPTTTRTSAVQGGSEDNPTGGAGGKRKAGYDADGLESDCGTRETRRMRARRIARNGEVVAQLSATAIEDRTGTPGWDGIQPQETKSVS